MSTKNSSLKEACVLVSILISTPFSVAIVTKLFAVLIGFLFGWEYHQEVLSTFPIWFLAIFAGIVAHITIATAYMEDR